MAPPLEECPAFQLELHGAGYPASWLQRDQQARAVGAVHGDLPGPALDVFPPARVFQPQVGEFFHQERVVVARFVSGIPRLHRSQFTRPVQFLPGQHETPLQRAGGVTLSAGQIVLAVERQVGEAPAVQVEVGLAFQVLGAGPVLVGAGHLAREPNPRHLLVLDVLEFGQGALNLA